MAPRAINMDPYTLRVNCRERFNNKNEYTMAPTSPQYQKGSKTQIMIHRLFIINVKSWSHDWMAPIINGKELQTKQTHVMQVMNV
jgi:hypothetical protein